MRHTFFLLTLSSVCGYLSLSQEIYWYRIISYLTGGKPTVFAHVLGFFLFGLAAGAHSAKKISARQNFDKFTSISWILGIAAVVYYLAVPLLAQLAVFGEELTVVISYALIFIVAALNGSIFPILCDAAAEGRKTPGFHVSWVYVANIVGSTAGPLITGFVLLNHFPLTSNFRWFTISSLLFAALVSFFAKGTQGNRRLLPAALALAAVCVVGIFHDFLYDRYLEKFEAKLDYTGEAYKHLIENRSGIIAVQAGATTEMDTIFGSGVYDGRYSIDPIKNLNHIHRAYMFAALHRNPADVLEIGLSSGTWARILSGHEAVKKLTIVEINPGYVELMKRYPEHARLLNDPKISINIDDGRRYLNRHPDEKYDFILMNATFHWRSNMTNLLSEEFMNLCRKHLKPGGVLYFNSTASADAALTAASVFQYTTSFDGDVFIAASDTPFDMTVEEKRDNLLRYKFDGSSIFDQNNPESAEILNSLAQYDFANKAPALREKAGLIKVTDDNMATEFDGRLFNPHQKWARLFE